MSDVLRFAAALDIQAVAPGEQRPPRVAIVAYTGGIMGIEGFGPVAIDLQGADVSGPVPLLAAHGESLDSIVGQGQAEIRDGKLLVSGHLTTATAAGQQVLALARSGVNLQASVGFMPAQREYVRPGDKILVNGRQLTAGPSGLTVVRSGRLREVSLLPIGADPGTSVSISAKGTKMSEPNTDLLTGERQRVCTITAAFDTAAPRVQATLPDRFATLKATAINDGWGVEKVEAELLRLENDALKLQAMRAARPQAPAIQSSTHDAGLPVLEAAFCRSCGMGNLEKHFRPEVLEAADRHRGIGLGEILLRAAAETGCDHRMIRASNLREIMRAAFSTHTITTLLTSTGNKMLLDGFSMIPQTWREVAAVRPVSDFKQVRAFRLTASLEYEEVGPAGEIKHGTMGQESYSLQAKTYARMLALTRQDIVNDDLGAFNDLRNRLGMGAAQKLAKVFWTEWLSQSNAGTFWTTARGNLSESSALGDAGIGTALAKFRAMSGPDGNLLGLEPDRMLVPPTLEVTARKFYASQEIRDTTSSTRLPTANIWQNRFKPIVVPELESSAYTGYSTTTWWLLSNPAMLASAAVCFLDGQEAPTIEDSEADFKTLGIQLRGYHDFGVSMSEYRASVKATA